MVTAAGVTLNNPFHVILDFQTLTKNYLLNFGTNFYENNIFYALAM